MMGQVIAVTLRVYWIFVLESISVLHGCGNILTRKFLYRSKVRSCWFMVSSHGKDRKDTTKVSRCSRNLSVLGFGRIYLCHFD